MPDFRKMAVQPIEFFVNVEFLRNQCQLDFEPRRVCLDIEFFDALFLFLACGIEHIGHALANAFPQVGDTRAA